jgi:threonine/homoserine/homoserine lactone efflux protein
VIAALATGLLLGLSCGLAPGPLMALVLAQSLRHGAREGCKTALAPLLTDAPVILLAWLLAARAADYRTLFGALSLAGGAFVLYLAVDTFRPAAPSTAAPGGSPGSWFKGILTNLLSPHPWLFWLTIGAATLAKALARSWLAAAAFLASFYFMLVGSKVALALLAAHSRSFLAGRPYRFVMRTLAVLLGLCAMLLFREGWSRLAAN